MKIKSSFSSIWPGRCPGNLVDGCEDCRYMVLAHIDEKEKYVECSYIDEVIREITVINNEED